MRRATRNGVIAVAAASGALAMAAPVYADSGAAGAAAGSPGAVSGNTVQLPVNVPVNLCGNTVSVVGLLNPAMGNGCANKGGGHDGRERAGGTGTRTRAASSAAAPGRERSAVNGGGAVARGEAKGSPGLLGGDLLQLPVDLPVNVSGNSVNVVGVGNPVFGNASTNTSEVPEPAPPAPEPVKTPHGSHGTPRNLPPAPEEDESVPARFTGSASLAHTGADATVPLVAAGALMLAGTLLYRRSRPQAGR
jgi:LPXTG-motif cell wall-anchored protein